MVCIAIVVVMAAVCPADEPAPPLQRFLDQLRSPEAKTRASGAFELGQKGEAAREAVPALRQLLRDAEPTVRLEAATALLRIDQRRGKDALQVLETLLGGKDTLIHLQVLLRCRDVEPRNAIVVEEALRLAQDKRPGVAAGGLILLDNLGPPAREAADTLEAALKDTPMPVRLRVAAGLARMDAKYQARAVAVLRTGLNLSSSEERFQAARSLLVIDPEMAKARQSIEAQLSDEDPGRRRDAVEVLGSLGQQGAEAEPALRKRFGDDEPEVALAAVEALLRISPDKGRLLFAEMVRLRDPKDKRGIAKMMGLIEELYKLTEEKKPKERVKFMTEQLRRPARTEVEQMRRLDAVIRLAGLGRAAGPATADLVRALDDESVLVRSQALYALGKIGPEAKLAIPRLEEIAADAAQPNDLRQAARRALKAIRSES